MKNKKLLVCFLGLLIVLSMCMSACGKEDSSKDKSSKESETTGKTEESTTKELVTTAEKNSEPETTKKIEDNYEDVDVDLTSMSSTMVYAEVFNMVTNPEDYIGKTVRMNGPFSVYKSPDTGKCYFACIIKDATACCTQGLEFRLRKHMTYPNEYPEEGTELIVAGVFNTYEEDGSTFCELKDAVMTY